MGPTDPTLSKNKKIILQNFGQVAFFKSIIFCFLKKKKRKKKKRNKTKQTFINNQSQEAFIFIKINYKLRIFLLCLLCKIFFKKY